MDFFWWLVCLGVVVWILSRKRRPPRNHRRPGCRCHW